MISYRIYNCEQGTPEWRQVRAGRVTGSKADCVTAKARDGKSEGVTRRDYRIQLALERLTGIPQEEGYMNSWMQDGKDREPAARLAYEAETGNLLQSIGFAYWPDVQIGCSPDSFVDDSTDGFGLIEIKCPKAATHWDYIQNARLPSAYVNQATHEMLVVDDAKFVDFVSYHPAFPEKLRLVRVRIFREELAIREYETELLRFLAEVEVAEDQMRQRAA